MEANEIKRRLQLLGLDRRWLAQQTGYTIYTLRDCLAPGSSKGISAKMAAAIDEVLSKEEEKIQVTGIMEKFNSQERKLITIQSRKEGFLTSQDWIAAKIRSLLEMLGMKPE